MMLDLRVEGFLFILGDREKWLDAIGFMFGLGVQDVHQLFV